MWHMNPSDPISCFWGFALLPPKLCQALSPRTSDSVLHCLWNLGGIETLSFLHISGYGEQISCSVSCVCFHSFSPATFAGMLFLHDPDALHSPPLLFLCSLQKQLPTLHGFSLPQFTSLYCIPAEFCGSSTQIVVLILRSVS